MKYVFEVRKIIGEIEMKVIDAHVHFGDCFSSRNITEEIIENLNNYMTDANICKCVLLSNSQDGNIYGNNEMVHMLYKLFPDKFAWMCNIDRCAKSKIYEQIEFFKLQGACGVGELMLNKRFDDPFYESLFDSAQKLDMPVVFHMSPCEDFLYGIIDEPGLPLLEEALCKFSKLKFVGHGQVFWHEISGDASVLPENRNQWGTGKVLLGGRLIYLLDNYKNLYCDLSANSGGCAIMRDSQFGLKFIEKYSDRLLFGSDVTGDGQRYPLLEWLIKMKQRCLIREDVFNKICFENVNRIYFNNE